MITKFTKYINESLVDKMKPKSSEEINKSISNIPLNQKLVRAVNNGLYWLVKQSLEEGADVNYFNDVCIQSAVHKEENIDIVKLLLEYGANVNINDDYPLRYAAENGYLEMVKVLLEYGANPNAYENYAIKLSKENGHSEIYKLLLNHSKSNESLIDKMKPKPTEEVEKARKDIIKFIRDTVEKFDGQILMVDLDYNSSLVLHQQEDEIHLIDRYYTSGVDINVYGGYKYGHELDDYFLKYEELDYQILIDIRDFFRDILLDK